MKLITTQIMYTQRSEPEAIKLAKELGIEVYTDDEGLEKAGYESLVLTEQEYFKYYMVLDRITKIREV